MSKRRRAIAEINVVPYIDVMLVLLIIFMVTAPLITQGLGIKLPQVQAQGLEQKEQPLVVSLDAQGQYFFNIHHESRRPLPLVEIQDQLKKIIQTRPNAQVLVEGDGAVTYQAVITLMQALQASGIEEVGLLTEPISGRKAGS